MKRTRHFDLLRDVFDHEMVDVDGVPCGMVDDVELEYTSDGATVVALWVGPGAALKRLPALMRIIARRATGTRRHRVGIDLVEGLTEVIRLRVTAAQIGLGAADRRTSR